jgi:hypothetical protein
MIKCEVDFLTVSTEHTLRSSSEADNDRLLKRLFDGSPVFGSDQWSLHANVFLKRQTLSRILYLDAIYREIIEVPGVIVEFGVQYGATLATLVNLRGIYEPYNHSRHVFGFDTFSGFAAVGPKDGQGNQPGDYAVGESYITHLRSILDCHERNAPISHVKKSHLISGDISSTLPQWLGENPHAVIAMAIFDVDVYQPTRDAIDAIRPRLLRNSVLVFDELNAPNFPGETTAVSETLGLNNLTLKRSPLQTYCAWGRFGGA